MDVVDGVTSYVNMDHEMDWMSEWMRRMDVFWKQLWPILGHKSLASTPEVVRKWECFPCDELGQHLLEQLLRDGNAS